LTTNNRRAVAILIKELPTTIIQIITPS